MSRKMFASLAAVILGLSLAVLARGQTQPQTQTQTKTTTVTETVQNPDGTFTVIEYPVGKEVTVTLDPVTLTGANGVATILRDDSGTRIKLNLTGIPAEVTALNLYAVDETGAVTSLGPVTIANGAGTFTSTTPLSKFMIIASPEGSLAAYDPNSKIFFRSAVPTGFAVVPHTTAPVGEKVAATTTPGNTPASAYTVPMLNIPAYKKGDDTKMKLNFSGALAGARANVFITPRKDGPTEVKLRFHELKDAPAGQVFILWAVSPDNKFVKLGQVVNTPGRNEAEIKSETTLPDFGLLVTLENAQGPFANPLGPNVGVVEIIRQ
jgi:hypothetical protein